MALVQPNQKATQNRKKNRSLPSSVGQAPRLQIDGMTVGAEPGGTLIVVAELLEEGGRPELVQQLVLLAGGQKWLGDEGQKVFPIILPQGIN